MEQWHCRLRWASGRGFEFLYGPATTYNLSFTLRWAGGSIIVWLIAGTGTG
jgi:hypothetical protein